jgi:hypothetical protein
LFLVFVPTLSFQACLPPYFSFVSCIDLVVVPCPRSQVSALSVLLCFPCRLLVDRPLRLRSTFLAIERPPFRCQNARRAGSGPQSIVFFATRSAHSALSALSARKCPFSFVLSLFLSSSSVVLVQLGSSGCCSFEHALPIPTVSVRCRCLT